MSQTLTRQQQIEALEKDWATNPRWKGVKRGYTAADVVRLRGSMQPEYTLSGTRWSYGQRPRKTASRSGSCLPVRLAGGCRRQHQRNHVP